MQEVDAYLTAVDSMPADLKNARVSWGDFKSFALLRQSVHRLAVALDFFFSTEGKICKHDFQHAVSKILGQGLPSILVHLCQASRGCHGLSLVNFHCLLDVSLTLTPE